MLTLTSARTPFTVTVKADSDSKPSSIATGSPAAAARANGTPGAPVCTASGMLTLLPCASVTVNPTPSFVPQGTVDATVPAKAVAGFEVPAAGTSGESTRAGETVSPAVRDASAPLTAVDAAVPVLAIVSVSENVSPGSTT